MSSTVSGVPRAPQLRRLRLWRAYSQNDLAKASGVSVRTIYAAERNASISLRSLRKLAEVLEVEPHQLTGEAWPGTETEPA